MKKIFIVASLLTAIATPAFAQSFDPDMGTGNNVPFAYASQAVAKKGHSAFAQAPAGKNAAAAQSQTDIPTAVTLGASGVHGDGSDGY
jgi:hypothetical protein